MGGSIMKALNVIFGSFFAVAIYMALMAPTAPPEGNPWYTAAVVKSSRPVLVKFGADWCGPCQHMDRVLDNFSSSKVKVVRVDIDEMPELAQHYGVHSIPRVFLVKDGYAVASHGGFGDAKELQAWIVRKL
jgi:thioredoxin